MKIKEIINQNICCGCSSCVSICPTNALALVLDNNIGQYIARLDESLCIECYLCEKVCPLLNQTNNSLNLSSNSNIKTYTSFSNDRSIRSNSASGGVVSQILIDLLKRNEIIGALIIQPQYNDPLKYKYYLAKSNEEILNSSGSVYAPVNAEEIIPIIKSIGKNDKIAIVGIPCVINSISLYEKCDKVIKKKIYIKISLFCGRTPNFHATDYFLEKINIKRENVQRIKYRGSGWPGNIKINHDNGTNTEVPYRSAKGMGCLFSSNIFLMKSCYFCNDFFCKGADLSIGDAWFNKDDSQGSSAVLCITDHGNTIFINNRSIYKKEILLDNILISQSKTITSKEINYSARIKIYNKLIYKNNIFNIDSAKKENFKTLFSEFLYMLYFLAIKKFYISKYYKMIPFSILRLLKLIDKIWR